MSFIPFTEKKIGICSILGRIRIRYPGRGSAIRIRIKMKRIRNNALKLRVKQAV